ncbi:hypothetical protein G5I_06032 [Acromyrmex echinatior]|uniref:Uncharacterized protein n=1 Tax=Acromyrmex echinatior TaxID=103372 RepID=F4WJZ6_ACREC|nr:hypothetical protein G5I_06032 [Acromyrmex echinatior]
MSWSILDVPTFRGPCSPLHQGEEQPDTELFLQSEGCSVFARKRDRLNVVSIQNTVFLRTKGPGGTAQYQAAPRPDEVDCKAHETLAHQEWTKTWRKPAKHRLVKLTTISWEYKLVRSVFQKMAPAIVNGS